MYILKGAVYPQLLVDQHSKSRDNYMLIPYRRELIKYVFKSVSASAIVWNELKNMSILLVGRYSSSDSYTQSWFPVLWICLICPSGPTAGWHFVLLFYIIQRAKLKKWQMWHLRCCQVTVQSWGKLDFDWLLVTSVKNKIDLLAVTDDDGWPVAEVDICGSWRRLGFLVHNSRFYFVVISSILSLVVTLYFLLTCAPPESVPLLHTCLTSASSAPPRSQRLSTCTLL